VHQIGDRHEALVLVNVLRLREKQSQNMINKLEKWEKKNKQHLDQK
jgi:hypothetical protein